jgi:hypothetical protein
MKILIIEQIPSGPYIPQIYFNELGYNVSLCNISQFYTHPIFRILKKYGYTIWEKYISLHILSQIKKTNPDIVLFYNIDYISLEVLNEIKNIKPQLSFICWHGDDMLNPRFNRETQQLKVPIVDIHVTPRHHLCNEYASLGAKNVVEINWFYKVKLNSPYEKRFDINFIGSIDEKRKMFISKLDLDNCIIGGYGWDKGDLVSKNVLKHLTLTRMNEIISSSKLSLNFLTEANRDKTNFRNFEIPSQFSLQIAERSDHVSNIFGEDEGIVCFDSIEEMNDKIKFYLNRESAREKIIKKSYNIVTQEKYTLEHQLSLIHQKIKKL